MKELTKDEKCYYAKKMELTVEKGCLFRGLRAVIPINMRPLILNELHATHLGIVKIKMFARSYVWWPRIDHDIETLINECKICLIRGYHPATNGAAENFVQTLKDKVNKIVQGGRNAGYSC